METIPSVSGKMFYLAHKLHKDQKISLKQKDLFKDLIIERSKQLTMAYQTYLKEGTELTLISNLIKILHNHKRNQSLDHQSESSGNNSHNIRVRILINIPKIIIPPKDLQKMSHMPDRI